MEDGKKVYLKYKDFESDRPISINLILGQMTMLVKLIISYLFQNIHFHAKTIYMYKTLKNCSQSLNKMNTLKIISLHTYCTESIMNTEVQLHLD